MRRTLMKWSSGFVGMLAALLLCASAETAHAELPSTPLPLLEGGSLNLRDLKGQVVVIRFLASWWPYCKREVPVFNEVYQQYKNKGVAFVGIFVEDTEGRAREFAKTYKVSFPHGHDWELKLAKPFGFRGMPYTVVLNQKGEEGRRFAGPVSKADLVNAIEALLKDP